MAREIFEVTKDRFHLQDPCCYILQGTWPKEAKMRACLDGSEVKAEIKKLEMVSALERFKDPDLMRGERITAEICLPESLDGFQKLSIYADMPDKTFCWFSVPVKDLEKRRNKPQFFIEEEKDLCLDLLFIFIKNLDPHRLCRNSPNLSVTEGDCSLRED